MTGWLSVDKMADSLPGVSSYAYCKNAPISLVDPDGNLPILPIIWAIYEIGSTIYDIYESGTTLTDKNASTSDKIVAVGGVALDILLPGGGYGKIGKASLKLSSKLLKTGKMTRGTKLKNIGGFESEKKLNGHFGDHGSQFNAKSKEDYLEKAKQFFSGSGDDYLQYTRPDGDVVKYRSSDNTFGVISNDGTIRTMFKPKEGAAYFEQQVRKDFGL